MNAKTMLMGTVLVVMLASPMVTAGGGGVTVTVLPVRAVCTTTSASAEANGASPEASAEMGSMTFHSETDGPTRATADARGSGWSRASASTTLWSARCSIGNPSDCTASAGVSGGRLDGAVSYSGVIGSVEGLDVPVFVGEVVTALGSSHVTLAAPGGLLDVDAPQPVMGVSASDMACTSLVDFWFGPNLVQG